MKRIGWSCYLFPYCTIRPSLRLLQSAQPYLSKQFTTAISCAHFTDNFSSVDKKSRATRQRRGHGESRVANTWRLSAQVERCGGEARCKPSDVWQLPFFALSLCSKKRKRKWNIEIECLETIALTVSKGGMPPKLLRALYPARRRHHTARANYCS